MTRTEAAALIDPEWNGVVVARTARKTWRCVCADPKRRDGKTKNPEHRDGALAATCQGDIQPGDTHFEYLGEAAAYESGTRYCKPCGLAVWGRKNA